MDIESDEEPTFKPQITHYAQVYARQEPISVRSAVVQQERERKLRVLEDDRRAAEERELTFSPAINQNYRFTEPRDSFLKNMQQALDRQQQRLDRLRKDREEAQGVTFTPKISTYSHSLPRDKSVFSRLFPEKKKEESASSIQASPTGRDDVDAETGQLLFQPRINPAPPREQPVEESLFHDAQNRMTRRDCLAASFKMQEESERRTSRVDSESLRKAEERDRRLVEDTLSTLLRDTDGVERVEEVHPTVFDELLLSLGLIRSLPAEGFGVVEAVSALWEASNPSPDGKVRRDALLSALILALKSKTGVFAPLHLNKLTASRGSSVLVSTAPDTPSFRPDIEKSQSRMDGGSASDRVQLLLQKHEQYKSRRQEQEDLMAKDATKGCTWKPEINERSRELQKGRGYSFKRTECIDRLHKMHRDRLEKCRKQRSEEEEEMLRRDCTFRPNITASQSYRLSTSPASSQLPRGYSEAVKRMRHATEQRKDFAFEESLRGDGAKSERKPQKKSSGITKAKPFKFALDGRRRARPLLYMDVNLGPGKTGRIGIHEGDDPAQLARNFADTYKLDDVLCGRLQELLEQHMSQLIKGNEEDPRTAEEEEYGKSEEDFDFIN